MKTHPILFLLLLFNSYILSAQTRRDFNFKFDGADRNFVISVPSGPVPAGGYPMVIMLHGTSGDGDKFYSISGWKELGEREKFISVFPSSLEFCFIGSLGFRSMTTKWNNGEAQSAKCPNLVQDFKDDVKFIRKVVDTLKGMYKFNTNKMYVSGFSNGSVMANKLAIEMSDVFVAAASSGGLMSSLDSAKPVKYIPIWETIGTHDNFLEEALGRSLPFNDSLNSFVPFATSVFRGVENLSNNYKLVKTNITYTYIYDRPNATSQKNYLHYTYIKDMEHVFPNGINYPFSAATQYWEFFKQASANTTPTHSLQLQSETNIYPNPAKNILNITHAPLAKNEKGQIRIFNILGSEKFKFSVIGEKFQVPISSLAAGTYHMVLQTKAGIVTKNFIVE